MIEKTLWEKGVQTMPRMKPPKGYYTITEASRILGVSNAMVRAYVQKNKIHYLLPEGREHGFYLKKDVDKLANELNAYINIEDELDVEYNEKGEKITCQFMPASKEDLPEIMKIGRALFSPHRDGIYTPRPDWRTPIFEKNPQTQYVLKYNTKVVGYATVLPFKQNTDKIERLFSADLISDANVTPDDIEIYEPGKHVHLYIGAIGIRPDIDKDRRKLYGARLVSELIHAIADLGRRGIIIETISAQGASHSGIRLLLSFGLHEIPYRLPGKRIFTMNLEESGSPVSMQYKEAFKEYKETTRNN
jgi:predicted transcriptional regulator